MTEEAPIYPAAEPQSTLEVVTAEERIILEAYRDLSESGRQQVWQFLAMVYRAKRAEEGTA